jgi:ATP-binding cassette, subfamily F, member 3
MIAFQELCKSFGTNLIVENLNFRFPDQGRVAIVGANGAGKTTLLNILCREQEPDSGGIVVQRDATIGYLPQVPNQNPKPTVIDEAVAGHYELNKLAERLKELQALLEVEANEQVLIEFDEIESKYKLGGGYELRSRAEKILDGLGFSAEEKSSSPKSLSGGWRMRLELAKIFLRDPSILVLDEPTNHLDLPSLVWVEDYLMSFKGLLIFVSHDRLLLNKLATHTCYLAHGKLASFVGNFDDFLNFQAEQQEQTAAQLNQVKNKIANMEKFVQRFGAKATKASQAQSRVKSIAKLRAIEEGLVLDESNAHLAFKLPEPPKSGRQVLTASELVLGYDRPLMEPINFEIEKGWRIAVVGANGIGKSTLLEAVARNKGKLSGNVGLGHNVSLSYMTQNQETEFDSQKTLLENISDLGVDYKTARGLLGSFLFRETDISKKFEVLSGGEKSRMAIIKVLIGRSNLVLLDEPTNHLDMSSVEMLIEALSSYSGSLLFVSHDRTFINEICTHVFVMLSDGRHHLFEGKLEDVQRLALIAGFPDILSSDLANKPQLSGKASERLLDTVSVGKQEYLKVKEAKRQKQMLQRRVEQLNKAINETESQIKKQEEALANIQPTDYSQLSEAQAKIEGLRSKLEGHEEEWLEKSSTLES